MPTVFTDGLFILFENFYVVLLFFLSVFGAGFLITNISLEDNVDLGIRFLSSLAVGSVVLALLAYVLALLGCFFPAALKFSSFFLLFLLVFIALKNLWHLQRLWTQRSFIFGGILFSALLLIRLAFLKHILLPSYSDSPIHYQIIEGLLSPGTVPAFRYSLNNIFSNYYHFGFHSLAAWMVSVSGISISDAISLLGQFFLILAPVSVSFFVFALTDHGEGAFFSGLLAALGWHMPAFAVNWGKFPALAALSTFPALLGYLYLLKREEKLSGKQFFLSFLVLLGMAFLHTRIIIVFLLAVSSYFVSSKFDLDVEIGALKSIFYAALFFIVLFPLLQPLQYFYAQLPILIVFVILLPFAFKTYLKDTVTVFLFVVGLWIVGVLPNVFKMPELLNKEFFEMALYIPLSIIAGMGFVGILKSLSGHVVFLKFVAFLFVAVVLLSFSQQGAIYPDPCCDYYQQSDALAFEFLQKNLPENSLVLISAVKNSKVNSGTDAGIWISPLLNLPTNKFYYDANWSVPDRVEQVCAFGAENTFIYVGGREYSFNNASLAEAEWYELVFHSGKTSIYRVKSCSLL